MKKLLAILALAFAVGGSAVATGVMDAQAETAIERSQGTVKRDPKSKNGVVAVARMKNNGITVSNCRCPNSSGSCTLKETDPGKSWTCSPTKGNACTTLCKVDVSSGAPATKGAAAATRATK